MAYRISKTDGSIITVQDYEFNRSETSLTLWGRGVINFGEPTAKNFVNLLENFSSPTPPANQIKGQLWFQPVDGSKPSNPNMNRLKVYTGEEDKGTPNFDRGWSIVGAAANGVLPPGNPVDGDLWLNPANHQLYYWNTEDWLATSQPITSENPPPMSNGDLPDGTTWIMMPERMLWMWDRSIVAPQPAFTREGGINNGTQLSGKWRLIGPQAPSSANTYMAYKTVQPASGSPVKLLLTYVDGTVVSVFSSVPAFEIAATQIQAGFRARNPDGSVSSTSTTWIHPGVTINDAAGEVFGGTSLNALRFDGLDSNAFLGNGRDAALPATPYLTATVDLGSTALRWKGVYGQDIYAGASVPGNNDISLVNLHGKAASAAQADKWTTVRMTNITGYIELTTGQVGVDGNQDWSYNTRFSSTGEARITQIANNAASSATSSMAGQFIAKNGSTSGFSGNMGSSGDKFGTIFATTFNGNATTANYADLAERYEADQEYPVGTIVKIGGEKEITATTQQLDPDAFGVISDAPAYLMNAEAGVDETHPPVALFGRVPVRVVGKVKKGQRIVTSNIPGVGVAAEVTDVDPFFVIGRALEDSDTLAESLVLCVVRARI